MKELTMSVTTKKQFDDLIDAESKLIEDLESSKKKFLKFLGNSFLIFSVAIGELVYGGWVLTLLWKWFIVTTFPLEPITLLQAIGIGVFVSSFKSLPKNSKEFEAKPLFEKIKIGGWNSFSKTSAYLLIGYALHECTLLIVPY